MAAPKSTQALLDAIAGFHGEVSGSKDHEETSQLLARVKADIERKHAAPTDSPGKREARAVINRELPAERQHSSGDGQVTSNEPGSAHRGDPVAEIWGKEDARDQKLTGTEAVPTRGNVHSNAASVAPDHLAEMRKIAADRELSRPDSKLRDAVHGDKSDGQKESVTPAPDARPASRVGQVHDGKVGPDHNATGPVEPVAARSEEPAGRLDIRQVEALAKKRLAGIGAKR